MEIISNEKQLVHLIGKFSIEVLAGLKKDLDENRLIYVFESCQEVDQCTKLTETEKANCRVWLQVMPLAVVSMSIQHSFDNTRNRLNGSAVDFGHCGDGFH